MMAHPVRRFFSTASAALVTLAGFTAVPADAAARVTLVRDGRPNGVIVWWSSDGSPTPAFAASEVSSYLTKMSGARLRIVRGNLDAPHGISGVASGLVIATGASAKRFARGKSIPGAWIRPGAVRLAGAQGDAYAITTVGGDSFVLDGADQRGTLYAAYDLLQRFGARFFAPRFDFYEGDAEYVPHRETVAADLLDVTQRPGMAYRKAYVEEGWSHTPTTLRELIGWMAKNRMNILVYPYDYQAQGLVRWDQWREQLIPELEKRGITIEVGGHGYQNFLPSSEYPQYYTSGTNVFDVQNDDAVGAYVDKVIGYLRSHPEIGIFDSWPPDGARWPQAAVEKFGSVANTEAHVVNALNSAVRQQLPGVQVERIAYGGSIAPPDASYMYDPSVLVDFAPIGRSYQVPLYDHSSPVNAGYDDNLKQWFATFHGPLTIYEYYRKYAFDSRPIILTHTIEKDLRYESGLGATGLGIYSEPADWITYEFIHLLSAAIAWNPSLDVDAYLDGYLHERYGAAAEPLARYFQLAENAGTTLWNPDSYSDLGAVTQARTDYLSAQNALKTASGLVPDNGTAGLLVQRLGWNLDYAIGDIDTNYYSLLKDDAKATEAHDRTAQVIKAHPFDGVILLRGSSVAGLYQPGMKKAQAVALYRSESRDARLALTTRTLGTGGTDTEVTATFTNKSAEPLTGVAVTLRAPDGWTQVPTTALPAEIPPGASTTATWDVRPPQNVTPGDYEVDADVVYTDHDGEQRRLLNAVKIAVPSD